MAERAATETVWGQLTAEAEAEVRGLWEQSGALSGSMADSALAEVVCLLRGPDGGLRGVSWVQADDVPLIAGRRFWIYRSVTQGPPGEESDALLAETFSALARAFDQDARGPIGLCLMVSDVAEMERRPQAVWREPPLLFAGYAPDGAQVRVAYFPGAQI